MQSHEPVGKEISKDRGAYICKKRKKNREYLITLRKVEGKYSTWEGGEQK